MGFKELYYTIFSYGGSRTCHPSCRTGKRAAGTVADALRPVRLQRRGAAAGRTRYIHIPESFRQECSERDILCCDFMLVESIAVFNAVATAEGAVLEALRHKDTNIHKSESLVIGYGRCGKILSDKLKGLSACVTVCSNSQTELAVADAYGLRTLPLEQLESKAGEFEYIYNTAPALLLTEKLLEKIREDALIIDIASGSGGVDYKAAERLNITALRCPGLPGKYAGRTSAKCLTDYVLRHL